jgi:hypothetical protein
MRGRFAPSSHNRTWHVTEISLMSFFPDAHCGFLHVVPSHNFRTREISERPCRLRLAQDDLERYDGLCTHIQFKSENFKRQLRETYLKNVYESTTSSMPLHAGSSRMSLSIKKRSGISTSSPASNFCSSKQKHSTFEKYGAIYTINNQWLLSSDI